MSAVARELGVSTSALYRWVADREALLDLVSSTMAERITPAGTPSRDDWQDWLREWAHNVRREFNAVPGFAVRVLTGPHRHAGHAHLEHAGVHAFTIAGADPDDAHQYWYAFSAAVVGWVAAEHSGNYPRTARMNFTALLQILLRGTDPQVHPRLNTPRSAPLSEPSS